MTKYTHIVYWVYNAKKHSDPLTEGYVGVTRQPLQSRLACHKAQVTAEVRPDVGRPALIRYLKDENLEDIKIRPISRKLPKDLAYNMEESLRPEMNIGWNGYKGGVIANPPRPVIITDANGIDHKFKSIAEAARNGYHRGNLTHVLKGSRPTFNNGCKARYA